MSLLGSLTLWQRELTRFFRQRSRIAGALGTPLVFWLLLGSGVGRSMSLPAQAGTTSYLEYFFPGTVVMILLFTAIFSTISIIEDRREGFLQSVLVAPVSRMSIVLGKTLGGTVLATGQGVLFLLLAPTIGIRLSIFSIAFAIGIMLLLSFALTALGICIAWRMSSTAGFHAIMNLFLMPMWLLSGALFPISGALGAMKWIMYANPLTYGLSAMRAALYWGHDATANIQPALSISLIVSVILGGAEVPLQRLLESGRIHRLQEVLREPRRERASDVGVAPESADGDHRNPRHFRLRRQAGGNLVAIHTRQPDIAEHQIGRCLLRHRDALGATPSNNGLVAEARDQAAHHVCRRSMSSTESPPVGAI
jgi:ABC-2 type transport system permease protein